jgi:hypothetical protein
MIRKDGVSSNVSRPDRGDSGYEKDELRKLMAYGEAIKSKIFRGTTTPCMISL